MNASNTAIGGSFEQKFLCDIWDPLGFFSSKLSSTEGRYSVYDREQLAVIELSGPLLLRAFHRASTYVVPDKAQLESIMHYQVTLKFLKGMDNVVADAFVRLCF